MVRYVLAGLVMFGTTVSAQAPSLTAEEKAAGWKQLFDGKSLAGWRGYKNEAPPKGWRTENGVLIRDGAGADLMTAEQYGDFTIGRKRGDIQSSDDTGDRKIYFGFVVE